MSLSSWNAGSDSCCPKPRTTWVKWGSHVTPTRKRQEPKTNRPAGRWKLQAARWVLWASTRVYGCVMVEAALCNGSLQQSKPAATSSSISSPAPARVPSQPFHLLRKQWQTEDHSRKSIWWMDQLLIIPLQNKYAIIKMDLEEFMEDKDFTG